MTISSPGKSHSRLFPAIPIMRECVCSSCIFYSMSWKGVVFTFLCRREGGFPPRLPSSLMDLDDLADLAGLHDEGEVWTKFVVH